MPPKGAKRKEPANAGSSGAKRKKGGDVTLPSVGADSLVMPHMRAFEAWFLESVFYTWNQSFK